MSIVDTAICSKPLAFAADAVRLWGLNRFSPAIRRIVKSYLQEAKSDSGCCGASCALPTDCNREQATRIAKVLLQECCRTWKNAVLPSKFRHQTALT